MAAGFTGTALVIGAVAWGTHAAAQDVADTIYSGGPILTINDDQPSVEAVAVRDGMIVAAGPMDEVSSLAGDATDMVDLAGRTMVPGFVDSHGHVVLGGIQALSANLLAPPDGEATDIEGVQQTLRDWIAENQEAVENTQLVIGFGYDPAQLAELRHPTRADLDAVSTEVPILIVHQSGHFGALNSKALEIVGYTAETENPAGGVIRRRDDGEPDGVLEEYAFFGALVPLLGRLGSDGFEQFAKAGAEMWARFGYTTGQEGRSSAGNVDALRAVDARGELPIDVVAFPDALENRDFIEANVSGDYEGNVRVGGCKLTIDGSPQGFTALRDRPYYDPVGDYPPGYRGYAAITEQQTNDTVDWCYERGIQILTHANGEGASDMLIAAVRAAEEKHGSADNRPVLIHGQFLREDQVDSLKELGIFPSLFPMHTFYWGDWHRDHTVGPVNADNISPTGWVRQRDMIFGSHHDAPVAFPNSMRVLSATVTRRTRSGDILGPAQRVSVMDALKALTIWPAWQHFEEDSKGSIEVGKIADLVILSDDPTAVDPETLADIEIEMTIKDGEVIYDAAGDVKKTDLRDQPLLNDPYTAHRILHAMNQGLGVERRIGCMLSEAQCRRLLGAFAQPM
ncbi:amidohydrolase [Amaricoccus tamworthensis]|uniref:amidohydrolase n=1 Tax=Amaricoccus tamworthensis TaxID=57002 RepID=UPI003C79F1BE